MIEIRQKVTGRVLYRLETETLAGEFLFSAYLEAADLRGARLEGSTLAAANLRHADLSGAVLAGANLSGADLSGADFAGADLTRADLVGAVLFGAQLKGARLAGAFFDARTRWPEGFNPRRHGCVHGRRRPSEVSPAALREGRGSEVAALRPLEAPAGSLAAYQWQLPPCSRPPLEPRREE
jgi:hypothetical protein